MDDNKSAQESQQTRSNSEDKVSLSSNHTVVDVVDVVVVVVGIVVVPQAMLGQSNHGLRHGWEDKS